MKTPRPALTMVELVVVVLIVGIMAAAISPRVASTMTTSRVRAAAQIIASDIEMAGHRAKVRGTPQEVKFSLGNSSYELLNMKHLDHPGQNYMVDLTASPYDALLDSVSFGSDGTSKSLWFNRFGRPDFGGSIVVSAGNKQRTVLVDGVTGKATVQP